MGWWRQAGQAGRQAGACTLRSTTCPIPNHPHFPPQPPHACRSCPSGSVRRKSARQRAPACRRLWHPRRLRLRAHVPDGRRSGPGRIWRRPRWPCCRVSRQGEGVKGREAGVWRNEMGPCTLGGRDALSTAQPTHHQDRVADRDATIADLTAKLEAAELGAAAARKEAKKVRTHSQGLKVAGQGVRRRLDESSASAPPTLPRPKSPIAGAGERAPHRQGRLGGSGSGSGRRASRRGCPGRAPCGRPRRGRPTAQGSGRDQGSAGERKMKGVEQQGLVWPLCHATRATRPLRRLTRPHRAERPSPAPTRQNFSKKPH